MPKWQSSRQVRQVTFRSDDPRLHFPSLQTRKRSTVPLDVEFAQPQRFTIRASGELTLGEVEGCIENLVTHPEIAGADVLVDASDIRNVLSTSELRTVAHAMVRMLDRGLGAVGVVTPNPFIYGVSRMFCVFAEAVGAKVGTFRNFDDANRWLAGQRGEVNAPGT
jgi:hypothetical protein